MRGRNIVTAVAIAILALLPCRVRATDFQVNPPGQVFPINNLVWGTSGANGFNNNYFFAPLSNNESVCVYVYNNNPTNAHSFNASITVNANPSNSTPSDGTWQTAAFSAASASFSPHPPSGVGAQISGSALVSINLSASSTQAGSPDTANVKIIQTSGTCFGGQAFTQSATQSVVAAPPLLAFSDGLQQSFSSQAATVNPGLAAAGLWVGNPGLRTVYFTKAVVSASAAATVNIGETSASGTTCTNPAIGNLSTQSANTSTALVQTACTGQPVAFAGGSVNYLIPAGTTIVIDLTGYISSGGSGVGIFSTTALTGTLTVAMYWYEK